MSSACFGAATTATPPGEAHAWALLVGVSGYPSLPPERQLTGPRNDVRLMRDVLKQLRSDWRAITVLADGVEAADSLPTRAAVLGALEQLARDVGPRDEVVIYFSGHGSQQPTDDPAEDDGLDEIFLPRDIGRWNGDRGTVTNAITDDEMNARLAPLLKKGAHVWAIFDTCHSGTMTRGAPGSLLASQETPRWVRPAELGIPARESRASGTVAVTRGRLATPPQGTAVVFEASQSFETTPEMRLPAGDPDRVPHGLFTYELAQSLAVTGQTSYQELADMLRARYASLNRVSPTPQFEGPLGDALPVLNAAVRPRVLPAGAALRVFGPRRCSAGVGTPPCNLAGTADDARIQARVEALLGTTAVTQAVLLTRVTQAEDADVAVFVHQGRVWFVAPGDDYALDGRLPPSFAMAQAADAGTQLGRFLASMATAHYLYRLGETQRMLPGLSWTVGACTPKDGDTKSFIGRLPVLRAGQSVCIELANTGPDAVDVTLLHVGEDFGIESLFPLRAESNRIPPGAHRRIALEVSSQGSRSLDRLLALAAPAPGDAERTDFSWAAQPGLPQYASRGMQAARPVWVRSFQWISAPASP